MLAGWVEEGSRKRKHRLRRSHPQSSPKALPSQYEGSSSYPYDHNEILLDESAASDNFKSDPLHALYIQAYEADVVRGSHAQTAAQSLEVVEYTPTTIIPKIGSALIRWGGDDTGGKRYGDIEDDDILPAAMQDTATAIWVDRYDARLLLDTLPNSKPGVSTGIPISEQPDSPTGGWSDLPSDTEDTFFFTPDETDDFRKEKRRRLLEQTREERLKARMEEDHGEDEENQDEDVWGGSDEEPDDPQQELMRRTATHLLSSPNAAQLEMRILANYGSDKRFSFLRGRWSRKWNLIKIKARARPEEEKDETEKLEEIMKKSQAGLSLVTGYGSDDDDADSEADNITEEPDTISKGEDAAQHSPTEPPDSTAAVEEAAKEARRKRAKEWAEKRREMKSMKI